MSDQEKHLNTNCQNTIALPTDSVGYGIVAAASIKPTSYILAIDGKKIIELTKEMGEGKIIVSNDHILTLLQRNPAAYRALWTILNNAKDDAMAVVIREALNTFFTGLLNEFHKDLCERAEANGR